MSNREYDRSVPFQTIPEACRTLGLSRYFLRQGCKSGTIPYLKMGTQYMIDIPKLMEIIRAEHPDYHFPG